MRRAERRHQTGKVAKKRAKIRKRIYSWFAWSSTEDTDEPGKFRKRTALGCNCSDHNGMCHARKGDDTARASRRVEHKLIEKHVGEF